ncbi:MAG: DUF4292 domain-containing protein [Bacteroidota bacterium]
MNNIASRLPDLTKTTFLLLFCGCLLLSLGACKTLGGGASTLKKKSAKTLLKRMVQQQIDADWLTSKLKMGYSDDYQSVKLNGYLRMKKDSVIWLVVKKLSVEVARIQITPDTFYVMDRINKEYAIQPFSELARMSNLPVTFAGLQSIILGNPLFLATDELTSEIEKDAYLLTASSDRYFNQFWLNGEDFSIKKMQLADLSEQRSIDLSYDDYQSVDGDRIFSYFRILNFTSEETGPASVNVEFSKVEINTPKPIRFDIPSRYTEIE